MRNTRNLLAILGIIALAVAIWRIATGGVPGPKTYAVVALGVGLLIAALMSSRRAVVDTTTTTSTTTPPPR